MTKSEQSDDLINRALAKATGANIHDVRVLCSYYRGAQEISAVALGKWPSERVQQRNLDIAKYERMLNYFAATGRWYDEEYIANDTSRNR